MKKLFTNLGFAACFLLSLAFTGCGGSNSLIDTEQVVRDVTEHFNQQQGVEVSGVEFSDTTQQALKDVEPKEGFTLTISGTLDIKVTEDLKEDERVSSYFKDKTLQRQLGQVVRGYKLLDYENLPVELKEPKGYLVVHEKGTKFKGEEWGGSVKYYLSSETGKLETKFRVDNSLHGEFDEDATVSPRGYNLSTEAGIKDLNNTHEKMLVDLTRLGKERIDKAIAALEKAYAPDTLVQDGDNFFHFTTPNNLADYFKDIKGFDDAKDIEIPFYISWIHPDGTRTHERELVGQVQALALLENQSIALEMVLEFSKGSPYLKVYPEYDVPPMFTATRGYMKLLSNSQIDHYSLMDGKLPITKGYVDKNPKFGPPESEDTTTYRNYSAMLDLMENNRWACELSYGTKLPARSIIMDIQRPSVNSPEGFILTTDTATNIQTKWELNKVSVTREGGISYRADRVGESERSKSSVHKYDSLRTFQVTIHGDTLKFTTLQGPAHPIK